MITLTKAQRRALKAVYDRGPLVEDNAGFFRTPIQGEGYYLGRYPVTYREFRRAVHPYLGGDCVLVPWQGMWLGIERDGYTHS